MARKKGSLEFTDSPEYLAKKAAFAKLTTIYGFQAVQEAVMAHPSPKVVSVLLAEEMGEARFKDILQYCKQKNIAVKWMPHSKLSRITRHRDEDQGIAADLDFQLVKPLASWLDTASDNALLLGVIGVTTPANIGIIARSVAGSGIDGMVIPEEGCPEPTLPLIVKASAGHILRMQLMGVAHGAELIQLAKQAGWKIYALTASGQAGNLFEHQPQGKAMYLVGNESVGLPANILAAADGCLTIPLANGVDSLNVAAAATLVAFHLGRKQQG